MIYLVELSNGAVVSIECDNWMKAGPLACVKYRLDHPEAEGDIRVRDIHAQSHETPNSGMINVSMTPEEYRDGVVGPHKNLPAEDEEGDKP